VERNSEPETRRGYLRGGASLIIAAALVLILLVWLPAYRWFFLGSLGIGVVVAAILYFWTATNRSKKKTSRTNAHWDWDRAA
jgi:uncharacterized membrane protein YqjE